MSLLVNVDPDLSLLLPPKTPHGLLNIWHLSKQSIKRIDRVPTSKTPFDGVLAVSLTAVLMFL